MRCLTGRGRRTMLALADDYLLGAVAFGGEIRHRQGGGAEVRGVFEEMAAGLGRFGRHHKNQFSNKSQNLLTGAFPKSFFW